MNNYTHKATVKLIYRYRGPAAIFAIVLQIIVFAKVRCFNIHPTQNQTQYLFIFNAIKITKYYSYLYPTLSERFGSNLQRRNGEGFCARYIFVVQLPLHFHKVLAALYLFIVQKEK